MSIDATTKKWIRNASDEKAAAAGCRMNERRGLHAVWWKERFCRLYEGEYAGEPMLLRGCAVCDYGLKDLTEAGWDQPGVQDVFLERARLHCACRAAGHPLDWPFDVTMRLYGWERYSERWKRWVRRFTQASIWVPKKNKKSPGLAADGLYLLCGDNEPGQKVYLAAKDGQQSREIAGKHAIEMVQSSAELMSVCTINRSLMQINYEPNRSLLKPISSADSKAQKAKEGLNGSVLIDETHVVDREFMNRVSRAGISRSEPLQIEVSTAGDDPEGYGRQRYEYGKRVEAGEVEDQRFFFVSYEAPQDLEDAALAEDPVKWGMLANPAWGHTIDPEEFLSDYNSSKQSLSQLAEFKKYRLNIWQASENPWLRMSDWHTCRREYGEDDLAGRECYAGLDLAMTRDTCALVLIFPESDGSYRQLPYFWLPRARAEALQDKVPYLEWARNGHLTLTDGDTTDYNFIRKTITEAKNKFDLRKLTFDDRYANQLIQRLVEEDRVFNLNEVEAFRQTITDFAGPTDQYEGLLIEEKLLHNGNPVLTWQAGNTKVKTDANHNKRPVKQHYGDHRTIDGVVAGIMALQMALSAEPSSVYETRGLVFVGEDETGETGEVTQFEQKAEDAGWWKAATEDPFDED